MRMRVSIGRRFVLWMALPLVFLAPGCGGKGAADWAAPDARYRLLVEVPAVGLGERESDSLPASLELDFLSADFAALDLQAGVDLDSLQVFAHDPTTSTAEQTPAWPFARTPGELASRFLDKSMPWDFPKVSRPGEPADGTFPRGAFLVNAKGAGNPGLLVWDHRQRGDGASRYAVYFNTLAAGEAPRVPRQGFVGDGSPRRDTENDSLTGSVYNRVAVDDWDGDGLDDLLVGMGFGNILFFRNEGDRTVPRFGQGEYVTVATGEILDAGMMASPKVTDWDGDGVKDLLVGIERPPGVVWYRNEGSDAERKLVYQGWIEAGGKPVIVPAKPCPEAPHYKLDYAPAVEAADWDGDGDLDLLLGGYITGRIWFYENVASEAKAEPVLVFRGALEADGKPIDTIWGAHPSAVDLDGDGDLDLLSGSFGQHMGGGDAVSEFLLYYENTGSRAKPRLERKPLRYEGGSGNNGPEDILAQPRPMDFNHDGLIDLVVSTTRRVYLAENVGTRQEPRWKVEVQKAPWGLAPLSASQIMDWNGDGHLDLIRSPLDSRGTPQVLLNRGEGPHGLFDEPKPLLSPGEEIAHPQPYGDPWAYVYLYDFDRDGDLDILWADASGYAYLHRNHGPADAPRYDLAGEQLVHEGGRPVKVGPPVVKAEEVQDFTQMQGSRAGIAAADFNGDGKTDIVMGDTFGDISYYENIGTNQNPRFGERRKLGNLENRAKPLVYDLDGDGRPDIIGTAWGGKMAWYRNLGPEGRTRFSEPRPFELPPTVPYSPRVLIADWNGDGDDDFLVMSSYPWFCWLEGSYVKHGYAQGKILATERRN